MWQSSSYLFGEDGFSYLISSFEEQEDYLKAKYMITHMCMKM